LLHLCVADPLPVEQMYHNRFDAVPGKLTVPRSKRSTSQLEGYHGAALNHVVRGYNTSTQLAIPQLTLTNNAWNLDRLVSPHSRCAQVVVKAPTRLQTSLFHLSNVLFLSVQQHIAYILMCVAYILMSAFTAYKASCNGTRRTSCPRHDAA
jgi:hypothetical protein